MLKILVLQKYHGLSEEATEVQIKDRLSFMSFLGLRLGDEMPDANTIWDFKELIDQSDRAVLGDSAYHSEEHLLECHAEEFLMRKAYRNKPLRWPFYAVLMDDLFKKA